MSDQHRARRVQANRSVQAMTFHNGQDSQFRRVMIHVPGQGCRLHNRELLDTAVTRNRRPLTRDRR